MSFIDEQRINRKKFVCHGVDTPGFKIKQEIWAKNKEEATTSLLNKKITILKIYRKLEIPFFLSKNNIKHKDITELSVELSTLISAGIPLSSALSIMMKNTSKSIIRYLLDDMNKCVESGQPLSEALKVHKCYFDSFFCNLVYAGENSGTLDVVLQRIVMHREKIQLLKNKIKKAIFYPCVILFISVVITSMMLIFVIPQFARFFENAGAELPTLTKIVMQTAAIIREYGSTLSFFVASNFILIKAGTKHFAAWKYFFDRLWLKCPLSANILSAAIFARCFHTLSTTLKAGLPLLDALQLTKNVAGNHIYAEEISNISQQIKNGQPLHRAMRKTQLFPERVIQMVYIGEESGHLENMLQRLAEYFSERVDEKIQNLTQLLEPTLMLFLSTLVGILVIAMYLPIFRLGSIL